MPLSKIEVRDKMLEKLRLSGLDKKDAKLLGFVPRTKDEMKLNSKPAAGFIIPYFSKEGKPIPGMLRYRYLEQPSLSFGAYSEKPTVFRYTQPAELRPYVYFPRNFDWRDYFEQNSRPPLVITEGELKAACACKLGIPTIALGGVSNFLRDGKMIPDLLELPWENSVCYIVYDSDARANIDIIRAENKLAHALVNLKADVFICRLPVLPEIRKTGLDDLLVLRGKEAFNEVIEETKPWSYSAGLHALNEELLFVRLSPGAVIELRTEQVMKVSAFKDIYANRIVKEEIVDSKGKIRIKEHSGPAIWKEWPGRADVLEIVYAPGEPKIVDRCFNAWNGWGLSSDLIKKGDLRLWNTLIASLFSSATKDEIKWFEQWLAYPIQHPGTKLFTAVIVWGLAQGTGKTLVGSTLSRIYGANFMEIEDRDIDAPFNDWCVNKQFIMGDEIASGDKRRSGDRMKSLITRQKIPVNQKFTPLYTIKDCINYYFTSNHPDSLYLEDSDRRYFVQEVKGKPMPQSFYDEYDKWYKSDAVGALFHHLLTLDLAGFNPNAAAPSTVAKRNMLSLGRTEAAGWAIALKEAADLGHSEYVLTPPRSEVPLVRRVATTSELLAVYTAFCGNDKLKSVGLSKELSKAGFRKVNDGETISTADGPQRLWAIDESMLRASHAKVAEVYRKERSLK